VFRTAIEDDLLPLAELERDANLVGLGHVFPPEVYPFPFDAVLARWRLVLDDPAAVVLVVDSAGERNGLDAYLCYDDAMLRHVAVHPDRWGEGLAAAGVRRAVHDMAHGGARELSLWVLAENHRARRLYEHLGWRATEQTRDAPWPPYPTEVLYALQVAGPGTVRR
jgi:GNAT superfamily N-acetyltransferase